MDHLFDLHEKPEAREICLIAGWRQWADAGSISSGLPEYLIQKMQARPIGHLKPEGYYLFQVPGTHHFLRPVITLEDGVRQSLEKRRNEFYYAGTAERGVVIFLGDEPHLNVEQYGAAFFATVKALGVQRIAAVGGVYGAMPYDKDRQISCLYSLPSMRAELDQYALRYSNYEGGATIGSYLVDQAEQEQLPFLVLYAFVPAYEFSQESLEPQGIRLETDFKAWYDILRRLNLLFDLDFDLTDLEAKSHELLNMLDSKVAEIERELPDLPIRDYLAQLDEEFKEQPFKPLDDIWEQGLRDIFDDLEADQ